MRHQIKIQKRKAKALETHLKDLEDEKIKLEFIRDTRHVFDAINLYIQQVNLSRGEVDDLRKALLYLTRGG